MLKQLAVEDPPAFMCHFYNVYFAHSAGGRMIGKKVSSMCLDDAELHFYKWDGDLSEILGRVSIDAQTTVDDTVRQKLCSPVVAASRRSKAAQQCAGGPSGFTVQGCSIHRQPLVSRTAQ